MKKFKFKSGDLLRDKEGYSSFGLIIKTLSCKEDGDFVNEYFIVNKYLIIWTEGLEVDVESSSYIERYFEKLI